MQKLFLKIGAIIAMFTVVLGAFAAHTLKEKISIEALAVFETAVKYQMYHAIALLITGILYKEFPNKFIIWAGRCFILGIIIFSGSLYLLTYFKVIGNTSFLWLGAITPFGGVAFIAGWGLLFKGFTQKISL
jgi:uncharacterized membrane protein YgdD (TMEM256/DUF423 family)